MGLLFAGIGLEARCNQNGEMGSNRVALLPYSEFQQKTAASMGIQSIEKRQEEAINYRRYELAV